MRGGARTAPAACSDSSGAMLRGLAVASLAAPAKSDTTFAVPIDTVENVVVGTGGRLAVGAALAGTATL